MSATPGEPPDEEEVFGLDEDDLACPPLAMRLGARKPARLRLVATGGRAKKKDSRPEPNTALADAYAEEAVRFVKEGRNPVGVVVNRVDTARQVHARLPALLGSDADIVLLTGRMRPLDRDVVLSPELFQRLEKPAPTDRPLVIVSTQCIEAGADFDFGALVTECASLDALRQRFGRLDQKGRRSGRHTQLDLFGSQGGEGSPSVILATQDAVAPEFDDPVYGFALAQTWNGLTAQGESVDLGIQHITLPVEVGPCLAPVAHAPLLLPAHLACWTQTRPRPWPDPPIAPFPLDRWRP